MQHYEASSWQNAQVCSAAGPLPARHNGVDLSALIPALRNALNYPTLSGLRTPTLTDDTDVQGGSVSPPPTWNTRQGPGKILYKETQKSAMS